MYSDLQNPNTMSISIGRYETLDNPGKNYQIIEVFRITDQFKNISYYLLPQNSGVDFFLRTKKNEALGGATAPIASNVGQPD